MISTRPSKPPRNDIRPDMQLIELKIADLRAPAHETRKLKEGHIREVANGIQALGFSVPVLVGKNNEIIDGLSAVKAAESLGLTSVPCVRIDHLSEPEQRVLHLAINRMTANGEWNLDALKLEFEEHPDGSPA